MNYKMKNHLLGSLLAIFLAACPLGMYATNPNLVDPGQGVILEASSVDRDYPLRRLYDFRPTMRWETQDQTEGVWLRVAWQEPRTIREIRLINKPAEFDLLLDLDLRTADFPAARSITLSFPDGSTQKAELRLADYFQIIRLSEPKTVREFRLSIDRLWDNSARGRTGLGKLQVYGEEHGPQFKVELFEMYRMQGDTPVRSAKIELLNPGEEIAGARLNVSHNGKKHATLDLETIPARSVTVQQLWIPIVYEPGEMAFSMQHTGKPLFAAQKKEVEPYEKNYFDGGTFDILNMNHNDLGFQDTQFATADYRSRELIGPALDLMREHPEFTYSMESVEYLKEFLVRCPERRDEIAQRMREGRFSFGAGYVLNLPVHVGPEKLVRQFYYGRRWLLENFPGCDTRFYSNVDVPGMTYQLPQILKKSGIDYMIQGRFPWGFYYWEGLDGSVMPVFALRYTGSYRLLNPKNNTGWLPFQNIREPYYREHNLPRTLLYDFNCDYLPPAPSLIPFVEEQNRDMKALAGHWNEHFAEQPEKQITPPTLRFASPEPALKEIFGNGELEIETIRGNWPLSWAYFDEPGHREGLLMGRLGHNRLLQAERINAWLKVQDPVHTYPREELEKGWLANCWPDHGWGGNHGVVTDSINVASYRRSLEIGTHLADEAGAALAARMAPDAQGGLPLLVYNASGWSRSDVVGGTLNYPPGWRGMALFDAQGAPVPYEVVSHDPAARLIELLFEAREVPSLGYTTFYARPAAEFSENRTLAAGEREFENEFVKIRLSDSGIASLYDKVKKREVLNTEKFSGGELIQLTAPTQAWDGPQTVTTEHFDRTARHETKLLRAYESPVRYLVEQETDFPDFTLRQRFILPKNAREAVVETDILNWAGVPNRELRVVFPMNLAADAKISYEVPFGTVEKERDGMDFSHLPAAPECQFRAELEAPSDLPFREAVNWIDASQGLYRGAGCLLASDVTLHTFRDVTDDPVPYPLMQHVLLSTRKSLAWNPENWFVQPGDHSYRMALYPHDGNWRYAYKEGMAFNQPLSLYAGPDHGSGADALPATQAFLEVAPGNLILSAVKQAEDGQGLFVRLYEAEGRYSKLRLKGFKPFVKASLTDMIEYDEKELPLAPDGSLELSVKPWEIINLRIEF